jgi:hypothetical protein
VDTGRPRRGVFIFRVACGRHYGPETGFGGVRLGLRSVGSEGISERSYAFYELIIDLTFVLVGFYLELALLALMMDLLLFGANKGSLIDIWMDLYVGVIAELQIVL